MAQVAAITRTSDISGEPATDSAEIALDGRRVELDLTEQEHDALIAILEPYLSAGTVVRTARASRAARGARTRGARTRGARTDLADVRAWATAQGIAISARGRVSATVLASYDAAH